LGQLAGLGLIGSGLATSASRQKRTFRRIGSGAYCANAPAMMPRPKENEEPTVLTIAVLRSKLVALRKIYVASMPVQ
jgi:hypothetical protein